MQKLRAILYVVSPLAFAATLVLIMFEQARAQQSNAGPAPLQSPTPAAPADPTWLRLPRPSGADWTRELPPAEPFGAEPTYIAVRTDGTPGIRAPLNALQIAHPQIGLVNFPGKWVWTKIDANLCAHLLSQDPGNTERQTAEASAQAVKVQAELEKAVKRIDAAVAALTQEAP